MITHGGGVDGAKYRAGMIGLLRFEDLVVGSLVPVQSIALKVLRLKYCA